MLDDGKPLLIYSNSIDNNSVHYNSSSLSANNINGPCREPIAYCVSLPSPHYPVISKNARHH